MTSDFRGFCFRVPCSRPRAAVLVVLAQVLYVSLARLFCDGPCCRLVVLAQFLVFLCLVLYAVALISRGFSLVRLSPVSVRVERASICCGLVLAARPCFAVRVRSSARGSGLRWWARAWVTSDFIGFCFVSLAARRVLLQSSWSWFMFCTFRWLVAFAVGLL